jgi:hypothetical protein
MDLTNKQVKIATISVSTFMPETVAKVEVYEDIGNEVYKNIGLYELKFNVAYNPTEEPALMAAINEKLAAIPD